MTRTGKIARLPKAIRTELNQRLEDGQMGVRLVEWLNSLPAVQAMLVEQFDGRAINEVNLTEWKGGGFLDWQARQDTQAHAQELAEEAQDLKSALPGGLAEHLNVVVAARYAELLNKWNGEVDEAFLKQLKGLRLLCQDVTVLRRGELAVGRQTVRTERLALDREKFVEKNKADEAKALERCVKASEQWPEVTEAFRKVFGLRREYAAGKRQNGEYEQRQRAEAEVEQKRRRAQAERQMHTARAETAEQRRQWMEAHPGKEVDRTQDWMNWKIDDSKRLKNPALMPAEALYAGATIDWSLVDHAGRGGTRLNDGTGGTDGTGVRPLGDGGQGASGEGWVTGDGREGQTSNIQQPTSSEAPKCEPHGPAGNQGQCSNIQAPSSSEAPNSNAQNGNQINRR
ncbi:MAG: hypothetical protein P4N60_00405 [Verrucomicrobiae bacterium]|nr:hypothetical protein [Verrucomicrobiae bacterium]